MKKLFFITLAAVCLTFVGCKKSPKDIADSDMEPTEKVEKIADCMLDAIKDRDAKATIEALEALADVIQSTDEDDIDKKEARAFQKKFKKKAAEFQREIKKAQKDKKFVKELEKEAKKLMRENPEAVEILGGL